MADDALRAVVPAGWIVRTQGPVALDDDSEPEPDVALVPGTRADYRPRPTSQDPERRNGDAMSLEVSERNFEEAIRAQREGVGPPTKIIVGATAASLRCRRHGGGPAWSSANVAQVFPSMRLAP